MTSPRPADLTLAVPYYSGFELACRTLTSIAAQTHRLCTVLVCDDSPAGLSRAQIAQLTSIFEGSFPLSIVRNERNLGMALTWNRCIDEATTELVTIVHGDDELHPSYAEQIVALANKHPHAAAVFCGASIISESSAPKFSFPDFYKKLIIPRHGRYLELQGDRGVSSLLHGNYIFCPTLCYRKTKLGNTRFDIRYRMVPDLDLLTRLLLDGAQLVGTPKTVLYHYRRHSGNATQHLTKELTRFTEECNFYEDMGRRAAARGYLESARTATRRAVIKKNLLFCIARDAAQCNFADCRQKLGLYRSLFLAARPLD